MEQYLGFAEALTVADVMDIRDDLRAAGKLDVLLGLDCCGGLLAVTGEYEGMAFEYGDAAHLLSDIDQDPEAALQDIVRFLTDAIQEQIDVQAKWDEVLETE